MNNLSSSRHLLHNRLTRRQALYFTLSTLVSACTPKVPAASQGSVNRFNTALEIWWTKGLVLAEDEAIQKIVQAWQQEHNSPVNLSFHRQDDIVQKLERAYQSGNPPDVLFAYKGDLALNPRFAWEGKLVDVSDLIEPLKTSYVPTALQAVSFYNNVEKKRSYFAVPLSQEATYIFYWRDLLAAAKMIDRTPPNHWDDFWHYWKVVQEHLRPQHTNLYGLGIQSSPRNSDTYIFFEHVLQAYNVQLLDRQGKLQLTPAVRQGIVRCLDWYTQFYKQGYVPPTASQWSSPDNNQALLNRSVVMTVNPSMSISVSQRHNEDVYFKQLGAVDFPNKPDGNPPEHLVSINQAVILASSQKQQAAKSFLAHLIKPQVLAGFVKSAGGRFFPVMPMAWQDAFWTNATDPYSSLQLKTLRDRPTRPFHPVLAPAYSRVFQTDVWGNAISRIATNTITVEQGAEEAMQQIQQIFSEWQ